MTKRMLIDSKEKNETRIAIIEDKKLIDFESEKLDDNRTKGNIYLAKIIRVEPSLQAAFVDYGAEKHGFLAYNEIHPDYFKIPTSDKKKLLAQEHEASKNITIDEEVDEDDEDEFENNEPLENLDIQSRKGFLNKFFDFFNFKPLEDHPSHKFRKKRPNRNFKKNKSIIFHRKYSIQEVIKSNQVILIQVVKEERGNKGAAVTTRLSLAGKYCVLMPNTSKGGGISRKIIDIKLRKRLKDTVSKLNIKKGMGVIIRTAGETMGLKDIKRDYNSLIKLWREITIKTVKSNAPCLIHEEDNIIKRGLRDYFDQTFDEILINDPKTFSKSKQIIKQFMPSSVKLLRLFKNEKSLFSKYEIEKQLLDVNNPLVYLKSGGYLVINQTEALVAIDINSGKSTKQRNIEDTAFKTNLEAAEEISKQIKIRDLSGLIVIDFIDMLDRSHNVKVEKRLRDFIKNDRARVQCGRISNFGLLELSRQRLKVTNDTNSSIKCKFCNGYGSVVSIDFLVDQLIRVYEEIKVSQNIKRLFILTSSELHKNIIEKIKKFKNKNFILVNIYPDLKEYEYLVCSDKEVILSNCHSNEMIENFKNFIDTKENSKIIQKNQLKGKKDESENNDKGRVSFRQKAEDFGKSKKITKEKKERQSNVKVNIEDNKMNIYSKNKKNEKRQGWWSQ
ncbi:MAG: Ribonuclease E [Alphaproteobacteria bacterium MarineAlpha8_Bin1]|nr:MAG: Ribonuclease E [Alphaproteobacteria bacterium MarineAlpha8_Bin1]